MITNKMIEDMADSMEAGFNIYINRENLEVKEIMKIDDEYGDTDLLEEEIEKIEDEWDDYIILEKPDSRIAFGIMEDFAQQVDDEKLKNDLLKILSRRSPFANFKAEIDESDYREKWFAFRRLGFKEYIRDMLEYEEIEFEKE